MLVANGFSPSLSVSAHLVFFRIGLEQSTLVPKRSMCQQGTSEPWLPADYLTPAFHHLTLPTSTRPVRPLPPSFSPCDGHCTRPWRLLHLLSPCFVRSSSSTCRRDTLDRCCYIIRYNALTLIFLAIHFLLCSLISLHRTSLAILD